MDLQPAPALTADDAPDDVTDEEQSAVLDSGTPNSPSEQIIWDSDIAEQAEDTTPDNAPISLVSHQGMGQVGVFTSAEDAAILSRVKSPERLQVVKKDSALGQAMHMSAKPAAEETPEPIEQVAEVVEDIAPAEDEAVAEVAADAPVEVPDVATPQEETISVAEATPNPISELDDIVEETATVAVTTEINAPDDLNVRVWQAKDGRDLKRVLTRWSVVENIKLDWDAEKNYTLDKDVFVKGTFKNALETLFGRGMDDAPDYELSDSPDYVLRVSDR